MLNLSFYLKFQDSSNLGDDSSGNGNDWAVTNLVATDQVPDSPTNNFATMNPVWRGTAMSGDTDNPTGSGPEYLVEGNLKVRPAHNQMHGITMIPNSGKWYCELYVHGTSSYGPYIGWMNDEVVANRCGDGLGEGWLPP